MARIKRIAIVRNGKNAGQHMNRTALVEAALSAFMKYGPDVTVFVTHSLEDLEGATAAIASAPVPFDLVVSIGGDGTTKWLMSSLLPKIAKVGREPPAFFIVPAGTMNIVPTSLKQATGSHAVQSIRNLAMSIRDGQAIQAFRLHVLNVNGTHGFIFGAGLPANAIARYNEAEVRGPKRALAMTASAILDEVRSFLRLGRKRESMLQPFAADLTVRTEGETPVTETKDWTMVLAATVDHVAQGCQITSRAYDQMDRFHLIASDASALTLAVNAPGLLNGHGSDEIGGRLASEIVLRYREPAERQLDGELLGVAEVGDIDTIRVGPLLTFLVA